MKSTEVRKIWRDFWENKAPAERKHGWATAASLIVNQADDPTTMFNTAGMQPLVPYLMGKPHPKGTRVYNIQWCVRTIDIEEVGDYNHLTFFEMMGNWSLGDYFKKESIAWSWEFLTDWLKLDPKKISVTVFEWDDDAPRDDESVQLWLEQGVPEDKIGYLGKGDNRWGPAGATGPCGPDTEIFYRVGEESEYPPEWSNAATDEDNWLEIWNNVFMAYYKDDQGNFSLLEKQNVDTGMGFERICMVLQWDAGMLPVERFSEASLYDTDLFQPIMKLLDSVSDDIRRKRIMADHIRSGFWLVQQGLVPSNEGRGYVLRRLIRRAYFQAYMSGMTDVTQMESLLEGIMKELNLIYDGYFDQGTLTIIYEEMQQFAQTITHGKRVFDDILAKSDGPLIAGQDVFTLYDTYGFPVELTQELAEENDKDVDMQGFEQAMQTAQDRSRQWAAKKFHKDIDWAAIIDGLPPTEFVGYDALQAEWAKLLKDVDVQGQRVLVFDKTPMYAEWGGQTGDSGQVELDGGETVQIVDVQKYGGVFLHLVG